MDATPTPTLISLDHPRAIDPAVTGAKASSLASARADGLPVLPGLVVTTTWVDDEGSRRELVAQATEMAASDTLVVRSSSTAEDGDASSMAGVFLSELDVDPADVVEAVHRVLASAEASPLVDAPMAVLIQPQLRPAFGGVAFSADPLTGDDRISVVASVAGGPDELVSGRRTGWTTEVSRTGRARHGRGEPTDRPTRSVLRGVSRLAGQAQGRAGAPQDIEWAVGRDGTLWLLQSRPITTIIGRPTGPLYGTGPLAETFPEVLSPLERELWLDPLRTGLTEALALTGAAPRRRLVASPVVIDIAGRPAVDLGLLGDEKPGGLIRKLDPRPPARRLRAAWQVGRLTRALPAIAADVVADVDRDLAEVPPVAGLSDDDLLTLLETTSSALAVVHGWEALAGLLVDAGPGAVTAASVGLAGLAQAQRDGVPAAEITRTVPTALALVPPRIGPGAVVPEVATAAAPAVPRGWAEEVDPAAVAREALRLRTRWLQELSARAAGELGARLAVRGHLDDADQVRDLTREELVAAVGHGAASGVTVMARRPEEARAVPARFRLTADGEPVPERFEPNGVDQPVGVAGGVVTGHVHQGENPPAGAVVVTEHLDPRLAAHITSVAAIVAETGNVLSHLAILAREHGVTVVIGDRTARQRLAPGALVEVDGVTGRVRLLDTETTITDITSLEDVA
ncbi:MAG TPA: PEP/pyruvate-binding domain-containing protein [Iamia sp.]